MCSRVAAGIAVILHWDFGMYYIREVIVSREQAPFCDAVRE